MARPVLIDAVKGHDRLLALAEANRLLILAAIDELDDQGSDSERVGRSQSKRSARKAKQDTKTAKQLKDMPETAQKLADGEITAEHAAAAADAAERVSPEAADELADKAASMPADRFAKTPREWANAHEKQQAKADRHTRQRRRRSVRFWKAGDGMVHLRAELDDITGADVLAALRGRSMGCGELTAAATAPLTTNAHTNNVPLTRSPSWSPSSRLRGSENLTRGTWCISSTNSTPGRPA